MLKNNINKNNVSCDECRNEGCLIKQCNPEWIKKLNDSKSESIYKQSQYIFSEGNLVHGIFFIQTGKVKVVSSNYGGKQQVVRLAAEGHILGHRGIGGENYPISAIALTDVHICFIDNQLLFDAFLANPMFTYSLMMFYSTELRKSEQRTKYFSLMTVEEKIIYALLYIEDTFGLNLSENVFNLSLTRQDIAEIAGTNAEQVSRTISFFKAKNLIDTVGRKIILLDYDKLKSFIAHYN
jgi:CRP-like cAMP-binding protein